MPRSTSTTTSLSERRRVAVLWLLTAALLVLAVTALWTTAGLWLVSSFASKQFEHLRYDLELNAQIDITAEPYLAADPMTAVQDPFPVFAAGTVILAILNIAAILCLLRWRWRK